jgi:predicted Zn-dependent protease
MGLFLLFLLPFLVHCSPSPLGEQVNQEQSKEEKQKLADFKEELEVGRNMAGRLFAFYGAYEDNPSLVRYINRLGLYVAGYSDAPDKRYLFGLLNTDSINAFACPGGYILITLGSIKTAKTEAELAMILGHEIAHVGKNHMYQTLKSQDQKKKKDTPSSDKLLTLRRRPEGEDSSAFAFLAKYLSGSSGAGFSIFQAAKAGMNIILEKGLAPEMEFEADLEGVRYGIQAGYEPRALMDFLSRLSSEKNKLDLKVVSRTHPDVSQRNKKIEALLKRLKAQDIVGASVKDRFLKETSVLRKKGKKNEK